MHRLCLVYYQLSMAKMPLRYVSYIIIGDKYAFFPAGTVNDARYGVFQWQMGLIDSSYSHSKQSYEGSVKDVIPNLSIEHSAATLHRPLQGHYITAQLFLCYHHSDHCILS